MAISGKTFTDILIKIRADDKQFQAALKGTEASTSNWASSIEKYGKRAALALGAMAVATTAYAVNAAADYEQLEMGFKSLTASQGKDADTYVRKLKEATRGTASQAALLAQANEGMLLGLDVDTLVQMAEGATVIAQATGKSSEYLFQSMALGTARQSRLVLDNLGIIVEEEKVYQDLAKSLGKTTAELTEQEKKAAFLTAAMKGLNDRVENLGGFSESTNSNIATLKSSLNDLAVDIGENFLPAINDGIKGINDWGEAGGWDKIAQSAEEGTNRIQLYAHAIGDFLDAIGNTGPVKAYVSTMEGIRDKYIAGVFGIRDEIDKLLGEQYPGMVKTSDVPLTGNEAIDKLIKEQYPELSKHEGDWNPLENPMTQDLSKVLADNARATGDNTSAVEDNTKFLKTSFENQKGYNDAMKGEYGHVVAKDSSYNVVTGKTTYIGNTSGAT